MHIRVHVRVHVRVYAGACARTCAYKTSGLTRSRLSWKNFPSHDVPKAPKWSDVKYSEMRNKIKIYLMSCRIGRF